MGSRDHSETCEVCGFQRGGLNDLTCACDHVDESRAVALRALASNLAIAGALCAAFALGESIPERCEQPSRFDCTFVEGAICNNLMPCSYHGDAWRPGCGRNAGGGR